jgi:class 3 adenylate cyclase
MNKHASEDMTVLFADVTGSVELYSVLGDLEAHHRIVNFLQRSAHHVEHQHGRIIETIGDE